MGKSILVDKSFVLGVKCVDVYRLLLNEKMFDIARQLLKSGTSIGANINEAQAAESTKDFIHKLSIAHKESRELDYWIKLLIHAKILKEEQTIEIKNLNNEVCKMLSSAILTSKNKLNK